jgi:hypothetical protein
MWNLILVGLQTLLVLVQERCTISARHSIGPEIILEHPMELLGDKAQVEACFGLFRDSVSVGAR